ncbi:lysozyme [Clostridium felsineum]|uniref:lysozyme n=1 Tax=Clostridium felsineum TaxID=36839 RepID=UPI00098C4D8E|nr:lysozyme [Clostridium felsineum]URZ17254.1 hypothetical protein CLFE_033070 [Clostridium felsineum DSM 794]
MALVSKQCVNFVEQWEGFSATPYYDSVGVKTIGYGMTGDEIAGLTYVTQAQASQMLEDLLNNKYAQPIKNDLTSKGVNLNQNQFDALVSFAYNEGVSALLNQSTLYRNICAGVRDVNTITADFEMWVMAGGKALDGLKNRRAAEAAMFFGSGNTTTDLKQPNQFCINQKGKPAIIANMITTGHTEFKSLPDDNSETNGVRESGYTLQVYGKCNEWYLVNNNNPQYVKISNVKAQNPLSVQKVIRVMDYDGAKCYENPDDCDPSNGTVPYTGTCPVYCDVNGYYLVNGRNDGLQWMNNNKQLQDIYPNAFTNKLNEKSEPLLQDFAVDVDSVNIKEFPHEAGNTVGTLTKGDLVQVYAKEDAYYLISNTEKKFVPISSLVATKPLSVIKQIRAVAYEGTYCRENPCSAIPTNGIVPAGKVISLYKVIGNWGLVNGANAHLQWIDMDDVEDI